MIELYHAEECPYCVKVRVFFQEKGISYLSKPISLRKNSPFKDELQRLGGKTQVPFLVDPERSIHMYESDDIIAYVSEHTVQRT